MRCGGGGKVNIFPIVLVARDAQGKDKEGTDGAFVKCLRYRSSQVFQGSAAPEGSEALSQEGGLLDVSQATKRKYAQT